MVKYTKKDRNGNTEFSKVFSTREEAISFAKSKKKKVNKKEEQATQSAVDVITAYIKDNGLEDKASEIIGRITQRILGIVSKKVKE